MTTPTGFTRLCAPISFAALFVLAACPNREVAEVPPNPSPVPDKSIPVDNNRDIDILFVIDDSGSMGEEQDSLNANFQNFINVLQNIEGGLPNVHIGANHDQRGRGCRRLAVRRPPATTASSRHRATSPATSSSTPKTAPVANYSSGSLAAAFTSIASLGTGGCGFEAPLESMRLALNGTNGANAGFIRENAFLAVIFITDEDDCSVENRDGFFANPMAGPNDPLGPFSSFRCFEFGIQCNPDSPRTNGAKEECIPRPDSPYLYDVQEYIDFLKEVKDENLIIVAGISGPAEVSAAGSGFRTNVRPNPDPGPQNGNPDLAPSCIETGLGEADPAIRLNQFITSFRTNTLTTICDNDLSAALVAIADLLAERLGTPCLAPNVIEPLKDNCVAWVEDSNGQNQELVPHCDDGAPPCWRDLPAGQVPQCNGTLGVEFDPGGDTFTFGSDFRLQCEGTAD